RGLLARARPYAPALIVSAALAVYALHEIYEEAGGPAVPLDDAFIHFQYAKQLAHGRFFAYATGAGYTTGATSVLWPALLAPLWAVGLRDLHIIFAAWLLGTLAHAAVAVEATRLARRLAGPWTGFAAGAMCLSFGAFAWFAWSGMETMALAWILLRCARL